jgi:uncharacterized membrane protein
MLRYLRQRTVKTHTPFLTAVAAVALLSSFPEGAKADWTVCNRRAEKAVIAIAYISHDGSYVTKGWWTLSACGGCAKVLLPSQAGGFNDVFLHAQAPGGAGIIEGDASFCIRNSSFFMHARVPNCPTKLFEHEQINLNKNWTTNMTGRTFSGSVCY